MRSGVLGLVDLGISSGPSFWLGRIPVVVDNGVLGDQERLFYRILEEVGSSVLLLGGFLFFDWVVSCSDLVVSPYVALILVASELSELCPDPDIIN